MPPARGGLLGALGHTTRDEHNKSATGQHPLTAAVQFSTDHTQASRSPFIRSRTRQLADQAQASAGCPGRPCVGRTHAAVPNVCGATRKGSQNPHRPRATRTHAALRLPPETRPHCGAGSREGLRQATTTVPPVAGHACRSEGAMLLPCNQRVHAALGRTRYRKTNKKRQEEPTTQSSRPDRYRLNGGFLIISAPGTR